MLLGTGPWLAPQDQVELPLPVLIAAAGLGRQAFERMNPVLSGTPSYLHIRQGSNETFGHFADRVQTAIAGSSFPAAAQEVLVRDCLRTNCLAAYTQALAALLATASVRDVIQRGCEFGHT